MDGPNSRPCYLFHDIICLEFVYLIQAVAVSVIVVVTVSRVGGCWKSPPVNVAFNCSHHYILRGCARQVEIFVFNKTEYGWKLKWHVLLVLRKESGTSQHVTAKSACRLGNHWKLERRPGEDIMHLLAHFLQFWMILLHEIPLATEFSLVFVFWSRQ